MQPKEADWIARGTLRELLARAGVDRDSRIVIARDSIENEEPFPFPALG